ncbi:hypothetical protein PAAG_12637 [Paracoccidioides lutzii Pb01]|uniref:Uncharacterized protein n=1 Tax=Paracoccidioides lutzii (strain ATCC MYA-826 / Pb01) TaxID=502779 RepID=A0A0A2VII1_PARBA|nr:hypothetical protein PAAG_12637 [Paracoccidioides lutzii Pb01]KGQ00704.1 hypothetical protein PAAG_12637 [Paracoccidioides lutzii Pb01]
MATNDIFSDDSGNDTDGTGDSDETNESDEQFWEEDKLPPPEHYEAEDAFHPAAACEGV